MLPAQTDELHIGGLSISLERVTYATIVLMSVLVVYDGWEQLTSFAGVALVIVCPTLALGAAHLFSEAVHAHAELERPLTIAEWRRLSIHQMQVLFTALPPMVVLAVGWVSPLDAHGTIQMLLWTGVLTLVGIAALAGRRAGFHGWRWIMVALSGGVVGLFVISLQILLKPH